MIPWLLLFAGVVLTVGTAIFVAAEFSLVALDRPQVQRAVDAGDTRAAVVLGSLRSLSTQLSGSQVGITLTTLILGYLVQPSLGALLSDPLGSTGMSSTAADAVSTAAALVIATLFSMVVGELVPQFLGISAPLPVAKIVAGPVRVFSAVTKPLIVVLNGSANAVLRVLGIEPQEELSAARTPQELSAMVRRSAEAGVLEEGTARLLTRSLDFGERTAADVMSPRVRCDHLERAATAADAVDLARRTGHSRFPVIGADWDEVLGVVHVKRAIAVPQDRRTDVPVTALMINPVLVPETIGLDPLLLLLRANGFQLAIVVDEYGGTSGVVTLEDVIEEIVGEVSDEHDRVSDPSRLLPDGSWTVPGLWRPDEVRDRIGAEVPEGRYYETVGGFIMQSVGRVPQVGDEVEAGGWTLRVVSMDGQRVDRVRIAAVPPVEDAEQEERA
ncbi:hemolysin family protein [Rudaeicoccus suwonensis]|uniref:CBS domain containing-hemolysin-like protein n=1 Tax=Rudaeicoccus suwonensis TaxID=657409 RepID=A0A561E1H3_9MICO|nr:hemolysin family protein [Rudaeicoccus suwonensis]TWE09478.1 CBS domain containing-hemolysin-like protein [Rudaeicoccus suwonensis]